MIRLDRRAGSGELLPLFRPYGVKVQKVELEFGDLDWVGKSPIGDCGVAVERKRIDDLIQSMLSKRLSGHQLPGMARLYDYGYLVVEGIWKPGKDGELLVWRSGRWVARPLPARAVNNYLMSLSLRTGLLVWRTIGPEETVAFVVDQYRMWQKPWGEHRAHDEVYAPVSEHEKAGRLLNLVVREKSLCEKMAIQLPGLDRKARWVAEHFGHSPVRMASAPVEEWMKIRWKDRSGKWKRMGKKTAKSVVDLLQAEPK